MASNRVPEVDAVAALFLSLTWITSALRCYVRGFMAKSFGIEDWLAILAQVCQYSWDETLLTDFCRHSSP
jgi:hypothetical protein